MNIQKRNEYEEKMNLNGIDTLSGYVPEKISEKDMKNGVKRNINQCNYQVGKERTYLLVNPNKNGDGEKLITKYSEFVEKMSVILDNVGSDLDSYDVIRADFCFNSTDKDTYNSYQKLHRLLDQEQRLNAMNQEKIKLLESKQEVPNEADPVVPEEPPKSFWSKFFKK